MALSVIVVVRSSLLILLLFIWLNNKGSHIILYVLLHQQIIIGILIDHLVLVAIFHNIVHTVIIVKVELARRLFRPATPFIFIWQLLAVLLHENLELLVDQVLRKALVALATGCALTALAFFFQSFCVSQRV